MDSARFLIVGGGMDAAVKGIREHDADGSIILVGAEQRGRELIRAGAPIDESDLV